jgi:hypothetical protein
MPRSRKHLTLAKAVVALTALFALGGATTAHAAPCTGTFQYDTEGYEWDFSDPNSYALGGIDDGGSKGPTGVPPGVRSQGDSYDDWGVLVVGDEVTANAYGASPPPAGACLTEEQGRELVFPELTVNGFQVQRKTYISPIGLPGARILNVIHNPADSARTTTIQLGDTKDNGDNVFDGDLGSDSDTRVRSSSLADGALTAADRWAVTSDHTSSPNDDNDDYALAHVFDGEGGADRIDFASLAPSDGATDPEQLAYGWTNVTIPAGGTVAYLSYEVQQGDPSDIGQLDDAAATAEALAYAANPLGQVYAGMTDREITAVRNWPRPRPGASFTAIDGDAAVPARFDASASTPSNVAGVCQDVGYGWDFGDGTAAEGRSIEHLFAAGTHTVTLTVTNSCGTSETATRTLTVAATGTDGDGHVDDATAPRAELIVPRKARVSRLRARVRSDEQAAATLVVTLPSGREIARAQAQLSAGQTETVAFHVGAAARAALERLSRRVRATVSAGVVDPSGNTTHLSKRTKVRP